MYSGNSKERHKEYIMGNIFFKKINGPKKTDFCVQIDITGYFSYIIQKISTHSKMTLM